MKFITIQLLGIIAWLIDITSYWFESKRKILFVQIIADIFYALHYYLLGAKVGAITCIISLIMELFFYGAKKEAHEKILCGLFITIYVIIGLISSNSVIDLLPILAEITYCYTLSLSADWIIFGGIIDAVYWLVYGIVSGSYAGALTDAIVIVSNSLSLNKREKKTIK